MLVVLEVVGLNTVVMPSLEGGLEFENAEALRDDYVTRDTRALGIAIYLDWQCRHHVCFQGVLASAAVAVAGAHACDELARRTTPPAVRPRHLSDDGRELGRPHAGQQEFALWAAT